MEITWSPKKQNVSDLKLWEHNPRQISKDAYTRLKERITKRGFHDVVKVDTDNVILSGNQRRRALEELGVKEVWTMIPNRELTDEERNAVALESNRNDGEWDWDQMANFDLEFLKEMGFDDKELAKGLNLKLDVDEDAAPEPRPDPNVKLGDLFQLGNHRLLCGDATKKEDVELLMDGQKADMVFTDPPYSVNYEKKNAEVLGAKEYTHITNDSMGVNETAETVWRPTFKNMYDVAADSCSFYMTMPQGGDQMMMMMMMGENWQVKHELIWVKPSAVFSMNRLDYDYQHEPIMYGWKKKHDWYGLGEFTKSVWEIGRDGNKSHPTMKPLALIANALKNSSTDNQNVLDVFGGSGSTLIACEQLNRKCYMMEIDPQYVRVIIDRWEKLTGRKATKING